MPTWAARRRRFIVYIVLALGAFVALYAYGRHIADVNYRDHLRSCRAQNEGRRVSNEGRAADRQGWLIAADTRSLSARHEQNAAQRRIDQRAAYEYRAIAARQKTVPLFDCKTVVERP